MKPARGIKIGVEVADVLAFEADVLALKYAQALFGADLAVHEALSTAVYEPALPGVGGFTLHKGNWRVVSKLVLFIGVKPLAYFGYSEIRDFARTLLTTLAREAPSTRHLALTIHGPGYGLDEVEAFESELAGLVDAVTGGDYPEDLETISFVERNVGRARRLRTSLQQLLPNGRLPVDGHGSLESLEGRAQDTFRTAGYESGNKPHVFVAMPFAEAFDDVFHYGIQGAANAAGLLCERADLSTFTGDVVDWIKRRIATATLVVADLTTANPNVYLEVGYAWGCRVPTLLVVKDPTDLKFDTKGQRCIVYKSIKQLEEALRRDLPSLIAGVE